MYNACGCGRRFGSAPSRVAIASAPCAIVAPMRSGEDCATRRPADTNGRARRCVVHVCMNEWCDARPLVVVSTGTPNESAPEGAARRDNPQSRRRCAPTTYREPWAPVATKSMRYSPNAFGADGKVEAEMPPSPMLGGRCWRLQRRHRRLRCQWPSAANPLRAPPLATQGSYRSECSGVDGLGLRAF